MATATHSHFMPSTPDEMEAFLDQLTDDELREIYDNTQQLEERISTYGPQNDDELHEWIKHELHLDIPRTSVCEDHDAPFTFVADVFFERCDAALLMANRGGGKTFMVAIIHWLNSRFKPGCESLTFGAVQNQSNRAYSHLKKWIYDDDGEKKPIVVSSLMSETVLRNGSKIEVLGSTPEQVNGPHPHKAHADEIELMRDDTWKESRNMTVAGMTRDGRVILPQDIMTSTRKGPSGRMQELIDEIDEAVAEGYEPPRTFYKYCIKETAHERPNCQMVDAELREARLKELGEDPCSVCDCHLVRKGKWEDDSDNGKKGEPRLLSDVCGGDFFFSRGWQPPAEIKKQFRENDKDTFEVQQLCTKAELKFHYFGSYRDPHHAIRDFTPDPDNGPIFTSTDWGGTNPHSVHWYQLLTVEIEVAGWTMLPTGEYPQIRVKEGTIVCFDEIYKAEIGNDRLGDMVIAKENSYRQHIPGFRITERFADPQGKAARIDWKDKGLKCTWHITREFDEHIKAINSFVVDDDLFRIVGENCPQFRREVKGWRKDEETLKQIDVDNHAMSDFRYGITNIKKLRKKFFRNQNAQVPGSAGTGRAAPRVTVTTTNRRDDSPIGMRDKGDEYAVWRKGLGSPVSAFRDRRP